MKTHPKPDQLLTVADILANAKLPQVGDPEIHPATSKAPTRRPTMPPLAVAALICCVLWLFGFFVLIGWMIADAITR